MRWGIVAMLAFAVSACGTRVPQSEEDLDTIVTAQQEEFDFASARTYALPPTVVEIENPEDTESNTGGGIDESLSNLALAEIEAQMNARGFTPGTASPDLFIEVGAMSSTSINVYYDYWSTYWGGYYAPYYGVSYGVGWAPVPVPYVSETEVGSLIINMTTPNAADTDRMSIPTAWAAVIVGLTTGDPSAEVGTRLKAAIQQAFAQSPYLRSGEP